MMMKYKNRFITGLLGLILILPAACGCSGSANAGDTTQTPRPNLAESVMMTLTANGASAQANGMVETTAMPASSESVACDLPKPSDKDWPVRLCDSFNDNTGGWTVESQDNPYARYNIDVQDGAYALTYTAKGFSNYQRSALTWFDVASAQNFALAVTGKMESDFQGCSWGVAFRADEDSFFLFSIDNDNTYAFEIYENNSWIPLITRRPYDGLRLGEANKLVIVAEGGDFSFYINDALVGSFSGGLLQESGIMLVVSAKEGVSANYSFDDLVLQVSP
jgi:hypothetical protein